MSNSLLFLDSPREVIREENDALLRQALSRFDRVEIMMIPPTATSLRLDERVADVVVDRTMVEDRRFHESLQAYALQTGTPISNSPTSSTRANDKRTYQKDFPEFAIPGTLVDSTQAFFEAIELYGGEGVVKTPYGSGGHGVSKRNRHSSVDEVAQLLSNPTGQLIVQPFIPGLNTDKRVLVQRTSEGYRISGYYRRTSAADNWKSNWCQGGQSTPCELDEDERVAAIAVAEKAKLDHAGLDVSRGTETGRVYVIETNTYPGGQARTDELGFRTSAKFMDWIVHLGKNPEMYFTHSAAK